MAFWDWVTTGKTLLNKYLLTNHSVVKHHQTHGSKQNQKSASKQSEQEKEQEEARSEACIKAIGGGEQTGRIVGGSLGGAVATTGVASIPYVGWVLAGAATMIGMNQGGEIGGQMAEDLSKNC